ncbi:protein zer-1 homolog isoform X2 [Mercenaria mercenaria]|uniref:protein zer-1 homolog isoform X2 n=1 Tax=Mercenaria mercenaria TaxID=6596 RepID=UPI00234EBE5F|nr:protein zer-1 homolog isoform X2 [Mercenaria mercenaria]
MAHIALNPEISRGAASSVLHCPDTLQDLCVFYLINNVDILVQSLNKTQDTNEEFTSLFSLLHANRMLGYYNKCCIPCDHELPYIDKLMEHFYQCDEISITTTIPLTEKNVQTLANSCKSVRRLDLTCFDNNAQFAAYRGLLENNLPHLTSLKLSQKCEEDCTVDLLNVLGGRDFDANIDSSDDDDNNNNDDDDDDNNNNADDDATTAAADDDDKQGATGNIKKTEGDSAEKTDLQIDNLDTETVTDTETVESEDKQSEIISNKLISNLKTFSYLQLDSCAHPNCEPCSSFGWFYALLSRVISSNQHLQSFKLVTIISNPIEWFLSQPDLSKLKDLQSLCLSLEFMDDYVADSDEIKMPYTDKFFTNLPVLQNLRHLDISCSVPVEDFMSSMFSYSEQTVEMFIEALKVMPQLKSLDISGTNLATIICHTDKGDQKCRGHCMPGFEGRRFDFLGLYGTDSCTHKFIPADRVSGTASIEQLVEALKSLQHNGMLMSAVIQDISKWIKEHRVGSTAGLALVDGLIMFVTQLGEWNDSGASEEFEEKSICIALEIMLSLVVDHGMVECFTVRRKRLLLEQLLNVCNMMCTRVRWKLRATRITEQRTKILEKSLLLIFHLDLERTAMYSYRFKQYIQVLLGIFHSPVRQNEKLFSLNLLYSVCKNNQEYKVVAGKKLELVKILLKEIKEKASSSFMPKIWNILWTLTEGVPCNCELFVQNEGLQLSRTCIYKYSDDKTLREVITATLVGVSENPGLITWSMISGMVSMFEELLSYENEEDFGVSSNAADFLIMQALHGPEAWTVRKPSRDEILEKIDQVMHKWDMNKPIGGKIRWSLSTVLSHLDSYSTPVAQYWAAWLIYNSIIVSQSGDGLAKIDSVLQHGGLRDDIVILLEKIRTLTMEYKEQR